VYTPTLTGFGERSHLDTSSLTFDTLVEDVANVLRFEDLTDVVLVGHSMGGVVIPRVAERLPERLRRVVWLGAVVTADGQTLLDATPPSPWIARAVTIDPDGTARTDPKLILDAIIHDGTPEQRRFVEERHRPYPRAALVEPGRLSAFLALGLPTGYIVAGHDRTIEPAVGWGFADLLPACRRAEVPGGHDCMITKPIEVATALEEMARQPVGRDEPGQSSERSS
jgi:pimeloyl-ACP methyl ester carboxylesterase